MPVSGIIGVVSTPTAEGWAIVLDGEILVHTVSPSRRSAVVNFITINLKTLLHDSVPDETIEELFNRGKGTAEAQRVDITVKL